MHGWTIVIAVVMLVIAGGVVAFAASSGGGDGVGGVSSREQQNEQIKGEAQTRMDELHRVQERGQSVGEQMRNARLRRGGFTRAEALPSEADCDQQWDSLDLAEEFGDEHRIDFVYSCTHDVKLAQVDAGGTIVEVG